MRDRRLKAGITVSEMSKLVTYPAPTYVIGVDDLLEEGFIMGATIGGSARYPSLPTTYPLADRTTLQSLYDEVLDFWHTNPATFTTTRFD